MSMEEKRRLSFEGGLFGFDGRRFAGDCFPGLGAGTILLFAEDDHPDGGDEDEQAGNFKGRDVGGLVGADVGAEEEAANLVCVVLLIFFALADGGCLTGG